MAIVFGDFCVRHVAQHHRRTGGDLDTSVLAAVACEDVAVLKRHKSSPCRQRNHLRLSVVGETIGGRHGSCPLEWDERGAHRHTGRDHIAARRRRLHGVQVIDAGRSGVDSI